MKITIFGASGKTGKILVNQALNKGHKVTAYIRNSNSLKINHPSLNIIVGNLNDTEKIKEAIKNSDACISALGGKSLTKHSSEIIAGVNNIVNSLEHEKSSRFIYISSIGVGDSRFNMPQPIRFIIANIILRVPFADHNINEQRIMKSELDWTVIRPAGLTDDLKIGKQIHGSDKVILKGNIKISRTSVASFILDLLNDNSFIKKSIWIYDTM